MTFICKDLCSPVVVTVMKECLQRVQEISLPPGMVKTSVLSHPCPYSKIFLGLLLFQSSAYQS